MTSQQQHDPVSVVGDEKAGAAHLEKTSFADDIIKPAATLENADHTGAVAKTDPAEIALVRKIDWRLMVCPPTGRLGHKLAVCNAQPEWSQHVFSRAGFFCWLDLAAHLVP
jgi:hypothetical protein